MSYSRYCDENRNDQLAIFFAGVAAGAIAGILFAPKPGSELRAKAAARLAEGRESLRNAVHDGVDTVRESVDRRLAVMDHTVKEGVAAYNEAREVYLNG